jgi:predicted  nucleic acid-binding Zn-ribbon protein
MEWDKIINMIIGLVAGGGLVILVTIGYIRRIKRAEAKEAEMAIDEKEIAVEHNRAERAWQRADIVESRIRELESKLDELSKELIAVKDAWREERSAHLDTKYKFERLKKKVRFECTCLNINWDEYE